MFRLIHVALLVLKLLMFKCCRLIGISKIEIFNFSGTEKVKQNQKRKNENHSKFLKFVIQPLFRQFQQSQNIFCVFN